ncbi:MAG TPA: ABC transporter ATP-binding protein [Candidatus Nanopelagicaceae bacterium]|jgi:ABC-2 type transport system ATP-binding protein
MRSDSQPSGDTFAIETKNLTKDYGSKRGLFDLNITIKQGEIFGLIGPNGAGKSTFIKLLMDLIHPTAGQAYVHGLLVRENSKATKSYIGYLPGELPKFPGMTGLYVLEVLAGLRGGIDRDYVFQLADRLQLGLNLKFEELSHGNKQKLLLIQAFMHKPALLILDEPTLGLDPLIQREFRGLLLEARDQGTSVLLSSHVLAEVEQVCDRIGLINEGHILRIGTLEELRRSKIHQLSVVLDSPIAASDLANVAGLEKVEVLGNQFNCNVQGSIDPIIKLLATMKILEFDSRELSLEEVFFSELAK